MNWPRHSKLEIDEQVRTFIRQYRGRDDLNVFETTKQDPEIRYLTKVSNEFCRDPFKYVEWLRAVALERLRHPHAGEHLDQSFSWVGKGFAAGSFPSHIAAEALPIIVNDLCLIEEMEDYGAPQESVIEKLRRELAFEAIELVKRLVRNAVQECLAISGQSKPALSDPKVRPLSEALNEKGLRKTPELQGFHREQPILLVLTAGRGTRLRTTIPKALLPFQGKPLLTPILEAAKNAGIVQVVMVLCFREHLHQPVFGAKAKYVVQEQALGTAHSAAVGLKLLTGHRGPVVLSYSDTPFMSAKSFLSILEPVVNGVATFSVLTVQAGLNPQFGRLNRDDVGHVKEIVQPRFGEKGSEEADAGLYALSVPETVDALQKILNDNHRYEYSLTQVVGELYKTDKITEAVRVTYPLEVLGVNQPVDYIQARLIANRGGVERASSREEEDYDKDLTFFQQFRSAHQSKTQEAHQLKVLANEHRGALFTLSKQGAGR